MAVIPDRRTKVRESKITFHFALRGWNFEEAGVGTGAKRSRRRVQGPYVRSGDNHLIQRIPPTLGITVNYWYAGSGNSLIRATQSGVNLFPRFTGYSAMAVRITPNTRWRPRIQAIPTKMNVEEKPHF